MWKVKTEVKSFITIYFVRSISHYSFSDFQSKYLNVSSAYKLWFWLLPLSRSWSNRQIPNLQPSNPLSFQPPNFPWKSLNFLTQKTLIHFPEKIQWERLDCWIWRSILPSMGHITATQWTSSYICCLFGQSSLPLLFSSTSHLLSTLSHAHQTLIMIWL